MFVTFFYALAATVLLLVNVSAGVYTSDSSKQKQLWEAFKKEYNKQYVTIEEETHRFGIFIENLKIADERTEKEKKAGGTATHGITKFSDLTKEEFKQRYLSYAKPEMKTKNLVYHQMKDEKVRMRKNVNTKLKYDENDYPLEVDYSAIGKTTSIKDQGDCNSGWAFAAASQIESDAMINLNEPYYTLSPQQLIECNSASNGCDGGKTITAYNYVYEIGGIEQESDYPYTSYYGTSSLCKAVSSKFKIQVNKFVQIVRFDNDKNDTIEVAMRSYLFNDGPLSVEVDASDWDSYTGGIKSTCGDDETNHAAQVVGIFTGDDNGYYKIRNSWGTSWGESGYMYLGYKKNLCLIATAPIWTEVEKY